MLTEPLLEIGETVPAENCEFTCVCGNDVMHGLDDEAEDEGHEGNITRDIKCEECERVYKTVLNYHSEIVINYVTATLIAAPSIVEEYNNEGKIIPLHIQVGGYTHSEDGVYNFEGGSFYVENNVITQVFNTHDENQLALELN